MRREWIGAIALACLAAVAVAATATVFVTPPAKRDLIEQGLDLEEAGLVRDAEAVLLEAASADRRFAPRWTLANFYFRRGNRPEFWRWAREGFAVGRYDLEALMDLCWTVSADGAEVWNALPERLPVWRSYLRYLSQKGRWTAAAPVVNRLLEQGEARDASDILDWMDKMAESGHVGLVAREWNRLCERNWIACAPSQAGVVNGAFAIEPVGRGLDWRFVAAPQVTPRWAPGAMRFQFGADAPESGELLWQPLAESGAFEPAFERSGSLEKASVEWVAEKGRLALCYRDRPRGAGQLVVKQVRKR
ncbi:MAG: hypothetical protein U0Q16_37480 [Bryobacteraceae bacterium]